MAKITPADFQKTATVRDSDLDTVATIDTSAGFMSKGSFFDRERTDNFLRAVVDKSTGRTLYVLYQTITYSGLTDGWRNYDRVTYQASNGLKTAKLDVISRDVTSCIGGKLCSFQEDFTTPLDEPMLRWIAARPSTAPWRFKFQGRTEGEEWQDQLAPAEAAGLLAVVDAYRAGHRQP